MNEIDGFMANAVDSILNYKINILVITNFFLLTFHKSYKRGNFIRIIKRECILFN